MEPLLIATVKLRIQPSDVYSKEEMNNFPSLVSGEEWQNTSFKAEIRTNFTSENEVKEWVAELGKNSGCSFLVESTNPKATKYSLSKGASSHILRMHN